MRISKKAYGKINLSLDVLGRREDGYHLVKMIMQTVGIYDTVEIESSDAADVLSAEGKIQLTTDSGMLPGGPDNLVWRAADLMKKTYGITDGLRIRLVKRIPIAAGMAGGSTDAAAVFTGLRDMYASSVTNEELRKLALPLGADIPYCIDGGTQLSEGIGEVLTVLPHTPQCTLVVVKPDLYVSTGWVYKAFDSIPEEEILHPDVDAMVEAIKAGDLYGTAAQCGNVLEQKTGAEYPVIGELERFLEERGAVKSIMTGSGPTVFGIFDDEAKAQTAMEALKAVPAYGSFQKFVTEFVWDPAK